MTKPLSTSSDMIRGRTVVISSASSASSAATSCSWRRIDRELLQRGVRQPERGGFEAGAVRVPAVDHHPLDHPHRRGAVAAAAVHEHRLVLRLDDRLEELVGDGGIGRPAVHRQVDVIDPRRLRGRGGDFSTSAPCSDASPEVDDRVVAQLLQFRHRRRRRRARAGDGGFELREVGHAGDRRLGDVGWLSEGHGDGRAEENDRFHW